MVEGLQVMDWLECDQKTANNRDLGRGGSGGEIIRLSRICKGPGARCKVHPDQGKCKSQLLTIVNRWYSLV